MVCPHARILPKHQPNPETQHMLRGISTLCCIAVLQVAVLFREFAVILLALNSLFLEYHV